MWQANEFTVEIIFTIFSFSRNRYKNGGKLDVCARWKCMFLYCFKWNAAYFLYTPSLFFVCFEKEIFYLKVRFKNNYNQGKKHCPNKKHHMTLFQLYQCLHQWNILEFSWQIFRNLLINPVFLVIHFGVYDVDIFWQKVNRRTKK